MSRSSAMLALAMAAISLPASTATRRAKHRVAAPPAISTEARLASIQFVTSRALKAFDAIENPAALVPFFAQLSNPLEHGSLHILHYGDSHTASDDWANAMRQGLQSRFGPGGAGFTLAGRPFRGYRRFDVWGDSSSGWRTEGTIGRATDGRYGLGGVSIAADAPGETISLNTECAQLNLLFLRQPSGGQLDFAVDGTHAGTIATDGEAGPGLFEYPAAAGTHKYTITTVSAAPIKVFGWIADNRRGITYETLGINGAQAPMLLDWDERILLDHLGRRDPALIVVAYGTNEALNPHWTPESYVDQLGRVLDRLRRGAPLASILVIGPPDFGIRQRDGSYSAGRASEVIAVQREIALQHRCAFWDWRARMGGNGSVEEWVRAGYGQPDHVHFTGAGYKLTGDMLLEDLMEQYRRFQAVKAE